MQALSSMVPGLPYAHRRAWIIPKDLLSSQPCQAACQCRRGGAYKPPSLIFLIYEAGISIGRWVADWRLMEP